METERIGIRTVGIATERKGLKRNRKGRMGSEQIEMERDRTERKERVESERNRKSRIG